MYSELQESRLKSFSVFVWLSEKEQFRFLADQSECHVDFGEEQWGSADPSADEGSMDKLCWAIDKARAFGYREMLCPSMLQRRGGQ